MKTAALIFALLACSSAAFASVDLVMSDGFDGAATGKASGVTFAPGKDGSAIVMDDASDTVEYNDQCFAKDAGRIEFDLKFTQPLTSDHKAWCLFSDIGADASHWGAINIHMRAGSGVLEYGIFDGSGHHWCLSKTTDWRTDRWYHLAFEYGPGGMKLEVDGKIEDTNPYSGGLAGTTKKLGWDDPWWDTPPVAVDNFRTFRINTDSLDVSPAVVCPAADGLFDFSTITYGLADEGTVTLDVLSKDGQSVKKLIDHRKIRGGEYKLAWDGKGVGDGEYIIKLTIETASGTTEKTAPVQIDRRWRWKQPDRSMTDFFSMAMYYFWEDDATYINRHTDDPQKARDYYDKTIKDLANHGINMIILAWTPRDHQRMVLDAAQKNGIKVIANLDGIISTITTGAGFKDRNLFDLVAGEIKDIKDHPALAGYYIIDEPNNSPHITERIKTMKRVLETVDPKHPSFSCLLGNYEGLLEAVDYQVLLVDIYPIYGSWNGDFSGSIGQLQRGIRAAGKRPLWVITQVFGKKDGSWRIPTPEEIRAQVWLALAYGARGIHYFIYQSTTGFQGEWLQGLVDMDLKQMDGRWDEIGRINQDLKKLGPTIMKLRPADFIVPVKSDVVVARGFVDGSGKKYAVLVNKDTRHAHSVLWHGGAPFDVLTGSKVSTSIELEPGDGKLLRVD